MSKGQRLQQVIFCKSKSSHKSFPCKSKSSHKSFPCKSKSSHKSFGQTSSRVKSQVIWSKHKSSHKSLCPSSSQVAHYFFHSRHKKHARIQVFWGVIGTPPPPRLSAIVFCLLICPGPCNNLDPLLKFLYETPF